jgi:phosphoglycolate/pyridoxal phosphate phosphatase family enzyme
MVSLPCCKNRDKYQVRATRPSRGIAWAACRNPARAARNRVEGAWDAVWGATKQLVRETGQKTFVLDLDGVVWRGRDVLPHVPETLAALWQAGHRIFFCTNNSRYRRSDYVGFLAEAGIETAEPEIMTSGYACALYLANEGARGKTAFVVGDSGLVAELAEEGVNAVQHRLDEPPDYVVVGLDKQFTYEKLALAQEGILLGARYVATNADTTFPAPGGKLMPGNGSLVAAVSAATGREPVITGKPEPFLLEKILGISGCAKRDCIVVGDRLDSDIKMARRVGCLSALILTGITTQEDLDGAPPELVPDWVFAELGPEFLETLC